MMTFKDAVLNVYYPAYKDLYQLSRSMDKKVFTEKLYFITWNLKTHNTCVCGVDINNKCDIILKSVSSDQYWSYVTRQRLDQLLFDLLCRLREQLGWFCIEHYPLKGHDTLKLNDHYTARCKTLLKWIT